MRMLMVVCAVLMSTALVYGQPTPTASCAVAPTVRETPPQDPHADGFGNGPWHVNAGRSIWIQNWSFPDWQQGLNQKVMFIRPAGTVLHVVGERVDGASAPLVVDSRGGDQFGFKTGRLTFPSAGCWKITATAGAHVLELVTMVAPR